MASSCAMEQLDDFLLTEILLRAEPSVQWLCRVACLGRKWKRASYAPVLWQQLSIDGNLRGNLFGEGLLCIAGRCSSLRSLQAFNIHILERPNPWMHHCLERLLEVAGSSLRVLKLDFFWQLPFTDKLLAAVGRLCPDLEQLKVAAANYFMTDAAMLHFQCYVRSPSPIHAPGDTVLWQIAKKWPQLQTLEINGNHVSENGIFGLEDCRHLENLSLHGYKRGIFDRAKASADGQLVLFNSLRHVSFTYDLPTEAELRRLIRMCPSLSSVSLGSVRDDTHATNLSRVMTTDFPHIQCTLLPLPLGNEEYSLVEVAERLGCPIDKY